MRFTREVAFTDKRLNTSCGGDIGRFISPEGPGQGSGFGRTVIWRRQSESMP
jgi:hypothetical protein